ncbi:hypothetical protein LWE61_06385 [Sphingobium sufflavum]|uniref:hypothetical protein n=1 Tax=Sphingobium sufflavum TaxID=1129547 RepID=UPI001F2B0F28|nr:hypothetical protein [Sphingobium sufflavum]MCE7796189.1 hypothetical protein [Sphingobium sufflavum]
MPIKRAVAPDAKYKGCSVPPASLTHKVEALTHIRTEKAVRDRFGISYYTWRRICEGAPVRTSLLHRLQIRVDKLERPAAG